MKRHRDLTVTAHAPQLEEFRARLNSPPTPPGWRTDAESARHVSTGGTNHATVFRTQGAQPEAAVWLFWGDEKGEVTNITPVTVDELSTEQYNALASRFADEVLRAAAVGIDVQIALGPESETIEDLTTPRVADALRTFSVCANKATGASHPLDAERWREFLVLAHTDRVRLDASDLGEWLVEEKWDDRVASELVIKYEAARALLATYDKHKDAKLS
jgi:hypothetical protein